MEKPSRNTLKVRLLQMDGRTDQLIDAVGFRVELHMIRGADLICSASKISNTDGRKVWHASFVVGVISSLFGVRWLLDFKKKDS